MGLNSEIDHIVIHIEQTLSMLYGFSLFSTVKNHFVSKEQLKTYLGSGIEDVPEYQSRAGVFIYKDHGIEDIFIGVHVDEKLQSHLEDDSPLKSVHLDNLDSYWVLIEEVSHFHLIINRLTRKKEVTKLELEWQGEIDKILVSSLTLMAQNGTPCLEELQILLHESSMISSEKDLEYLYNEANRLAARFWRKLMGKKHPLDKGSIDLFREFYWAPWAYKYAKLSRV
jgi:hypothetical protein